MQTLLIILAALLGTVLIVSLSWPVVESFLKYKRRIRRLESMQTRPKFGKKSIFLDSFELKTLESLRQMVGSDKVVYPKVHLACLMKRTSGQESADPQLAAYIRQQVVDYVICDASTQQPITVIMLRNAEDKSAQTLDARQIFDDLLISAGLPVMPISKKQTPNPLQIAQSLESALATFVKQQADAA